MKLRTQILAFGVAGALLAALTGGIGLIAASRLAGSIDDVVLASKALQASQEADMMHDAIRADAQLSFLGALEGNGEQRKVAAEGLAEHAARYDETLGQLAAMPLSAPARKALDAVRPVVNTYVDAARHVIDSSGVEGARAALPALQTSFAELEDLMEAMSAAIEAQGGELNGEAKARVLSARMTIGAALAIATAFLAAAALWLARRMTRPMDHAVAVADRIADGNLAGAIEPVGNAETRRLLAALARMRENIAGIVHQVQRNADQVASASSQIAHGNNDLSARTEEQASALQQTAASMEQLGATVRRNADSARHGNDLALRASGVAAQGGAVVGQVVQTMRGIEDSARKIADINDVIDHIAFRTNILALNAAVEAARAGEQGRGFAVVAAEVRALAHRSAEAAREIKALIGVSVDRVAQGGALVDRAGVTMTEVVAAISRVAEIMGQITTASAEQSAGVAQVGGAVEQMDAATQRNAALVEESAAAAESLKVQARALVDAVAVFRLAGTCPALA